MNAAESYKNRIELLQGTLDMLILQALQWGQMHGYGIAQSIRLKSNEVLQVETGSLYPALHRMERQKWIAAEWRVTEQNQRARFYRVTAEGRRQRANDRSKWETMVAAIASILEA
jgi:PadR family transcriptional regulator, regulatory protein PadR